MRRPASLLSLTIAAAVFLVTLADVASAASIYRWQDGAGGVHFSNRTEVVPAFAREVELPPLQTSVTRPRAPARAALTAEPSKAHARHFPAGECGPGDPSGVGEAIVSRLASARRTENLTVFVAGVPVMYRPGVAVTVQARDVSDERSVPVEQASLAYPAGSACPARPPLARYAVSPGNGSASRSLCNDYRRAFAQVGVAVSRDQRIARSFGAFAEDFSAIAAQGYTARERGRGVLISGSLFTDVTSRGWTVIPALETRARDVPIPPWVVEAHIAQTGELADETRDFVEELTVALEEIDHAARAGGCW